MEVPRSVLASALAAFEQWAADVEVLDLVYDSVLDPRDPDVTRQPDSLRTVVFSGAAEVQIDVMDAPVLQELLVDIRPPRSVRVELICPVPQLHLVVTGRPPLRLLSSAYGPSALDISTDPEDGPVQRWRTAWLLL